MKKFVFGLFAGIMLTAGYVAFAQKPVMVNAEGLRYRDVSILSTEKCVMIGTGQKRIVIWLEDGKVKWPGFKTVDEAARKFWDAVVCDYPDFRTFIVNDYKQKGK